MQKEKYMGTESSLAMGRLAWPVIEIKQILEVS